MRASRGRRVVAAGLLLGLLVGCTDDAPEPDATPTAAPSATAPAAEQDAAGDRVTVIVGPPTHVSTAEAAALVRAATALAKEPPAGVREVRVVQAESAAFTLDLVDLAVDSGVDVVCIVGTGAAPLLLEAALTRREARFCGTDGRVQGGPVNISTVALDPVALVEAGAAAIGSTPAPVGLLLAAGLGEADALTAAFTAAVRAPIQPVPEPTPAPAQGPTPTTTPTPRPSPTAGVSPTPPASPNAAPAAPGPSPSPTASPAPSPAPGPTPTTVPSPAPSPSRTVDAFATVVASGGQQSLTKAAEDLAARSPSRSLVLATPGTDLAAPIVVAGGSTLVVVADWAVDPQGSLPNGLLAALTVDWSVLLRQAVQAALDDESGQVQLLGLEDGVVGVLPGSVPGAAAAVERTLARVEAAVAEAADAAATEDAGDEDEESPDS